MERRRRAKYSALTGEGLEAEEDADVELGEGPGLSGREPGGEQETGVVSLDGSAMGKGRTVEEELDNWDENQPDDWDDEDDATAHDGPAKMTPATSSADSTEEPRKKVAVD